LAAHERYGRRDPWLLDPTAATRIEFIDTKGTNFHNIGFTERPWLLFLSPRW